jgi:hypothetical protein
MRALAAGHVRREVIGTLDLILRDVREHEIYNRPIRRRPLVPGLALLAIGALIHDGRERGAEAVRDVARVITPPA